MTHVDVARDQGVGIVLETPTWRASADWGAVLGFDTAPIPESSIEKTPSAELRTEQSDQDTLPPYEQLDSIIEHFVEHERPPEQIIEMTGLDGAMVRHWVSAINRAQYKREQAAVVLKVTGRAFGPGRPMPIAMKSTVLPRSTPDAAATRTKQA